MVQVLQTLLGVLVALLMLGLGATISFQGLKRSIRNWRAPLVGFCCQSLIMPLLAYICAKMFALDSVVAIGVVAMGCAPGGTTSNLFSHWSKGDLPLSITLTIISSLLSFGTLPLLLLIYGSEFTTDEVKIPYTNILTALALVIIPVGVGMSVKSWNNKIAKYLEKGASVLGVIFVVAAFVFGAVTEASIFSADPEVYGTASILLVAGASLGYLIAFIFRLPHFQCRTIALETGIQNSTLVIAIIALSFPVTDDDPESSSRQSRALQFPLLYSAFLIIDCIIITGIFLFISRYDPPEQVQARLEADRVAAELDAGRDGSTTPATPSATPEADDTTKSGAATDAVQPEGVDIELGRARGADLSVRAGAAASAEGADGGLSPTTPAADGEMPTPMQEAQTLVHHHRRSS